MFFIARRSGNFIVPDGADAWHYVAMVRYRSRRDFVRHGQPRLHLAYQVSCRVRVRLKQGEQRVLQ